MKNSFISILIISLIYNNVIHSQNVLWNTIVDSSVIFSSPRFCDLNQDNILDVIIGGGMEYDSSQNGILAINGQNGQILWNTASSSQIYTSALFQDINSDNINDIFIGGRHASFLALNGVDGSIIWKFWPDKIN